MIWEYGNYKFKWKRERPTQEKFDAWLSDFLKFDNIKKYKVWLTGGFVEDWETWDIDIILTNKPIYSELQKIMIDGIILGVTKYNIFIDLTHWDIEPYKLNYKTKEKKTVYKTVIGNKIVENGRMITNYMDSIEVYPNLYSFNKEYPTERQMGRIYKHSPMLLH